MPRWLSFSLLLCLGTAQAAGEPAFFETHARPILKAFCVECHGEESKPKGGLDLRLARTTLKGGESGPAIVAGNPEASDLISRVRDGTMPPGKKKLSPAEIETLARWIRDGAKTNRPEPQTAAAGMLITAEDRAWWAFQPIRAPKVPDARGTIRSPVDAFILDRLGREKWEMNP